MKLFSEFLTRKKIYVGKFYKISRNLYCIEIYSLKNFLNTEISAKKKTIEKKILLCC